MEYKLYKLDEIGTLGRGKSKHRPRNDGILYGGQYPFIQTSDVKHAPFYVTSYSQTYNEKGLAQSKLWKAGTLCITIAANIAETAILGLDACFPDSIIGFEADVKKADTKFVKYCLDTYKLQMQSISQGTTQDNLSLNKLLSLDFPVPELTIQRKIAAVLSAYDDLIENNKRRIALLEQMAEELYREWFVRLRFPGHEHTRIVKGVPEGWESVSLSSIGDFLNGYAFKPAHWTEEGIPIIKIKEMSGGVTASTPRNSGESIKQKYHFTDGAIIFSWSGTFLAKIWDEGPGLLNQHLFKVTPKAAIPTPYLYHAIQASIEVFEMLATGATMKHIKRKELDFVKVNLPPKSVLRKFSGQVTPLNEERLYLARANRRLIQTRNLLLPRLISGKLRVDDLDIQLPPSMAPAVTPDSTEEVPQQGELFHA